MSIRESASPRAGIRLPAITALALLVMLIGSAGYAPPASAAPRADAGSIPVVFVPGIGGTRLADINNDEYWTAAGYLNHAGLTLYPDQTHPTLYPTNAITEATFLGIHIPSEDDQTYGPFLDFLQGQGFRLYQTYGDAYYQTSAGCDVANQKADNPNLFVFAYDWRLSNADNAVLLADYITCVQQFYPNTKVNLLAHSMGGLVSRRYIIQYPTNPVNALITVGSPFLGAGKVGWVMETGDYVFFVADSTLLGVVGSFTGAHELLPSEAWYDLGGVPAIVEDGQDLNQNGIYYEQYSYSELIGYMNAFKGKEGFLPGTANQTFHSYAGQKGAQDDWRGDTTGVRYFHIAGSGSAPDTIGQTVATTFLKCLKNFTICNFSEDMYPTYVLGDGTAAYLGVTRINGTTNYNAPGATVYTCQASDTNDANVGHTTMLSNPVVQGLIVQWLEQANGATPQPPPDPSVCGNGGAAPVSPAHAKTHHRIVIDGADDIAITDAQGNTNDQDAATFGGFVPGAAKFAMNAHAASLLLEDTGDYTVSFRTRGGPLLIEWTFGTANHPRRAARYLDLELPAGKSAQLRVQGAQVADLTYDADADGTFETTVQPSVKVKGKLARDVKEPQIEMSSATRRAGVSVTLNTTDTLAGVWRVFYSFDRQHFQPYTGTFAVDPRAVPTIYAFADDRAGNRSRLFEFPVNP